MCKVPLGVKRTFGVFKIVLTIRATTLNLGNNYLSLYEVVVSNSLIEGAKKDKLLKKGVFSFILEKTI